ncbi:MAG TPA: ubiquinol oxidase subunit II [Candidatus Paceibacterota bacterium]|jgi:cytochrome o ubiquinol oxidase subunit 2|nr:ubiquinol oxidase subunit II [Candidatus Paceibacterota bacterium]
MDSFLTHAFPVLIPSGSIGAAERDLMLHAVALMLIVVVPVFILAIFIAWHYRAENKKAKYTPNWEHSRMEEFIWWAIPFEIVLVLSALTWSSTHALDPAKPLVSTQPPMVIQVVALPWKWLFIYPEQGVASLNEVALPVGRPVEFQITADAPMNSFWIPALGGQEYAMTGMTTDLHLMATQPGAYPGGSANYSGEGFAQMKFTARALNQADFNDWVARAQQSPAMLMPEDYAALRQPSAAGNVQYYGMVGMEFQDIVSGSMGMSMSSSTMMMH